MPSLETMPSVGKARDTGWGFEQRILIQEHLMEMMGVDLLNKERGNSQALEWVKKYAEEFDVITRDNLVLQSKLLSEDEAVRASALEEVKDGLFKNAS